MKKPKPDAKGVAAETATIARTEALKPSRSDIEAMGATIKDNPDGTWTASLSGLKQTRALAEANRPWARAANEQRLRNSAAVPTEFLKRSDGSLVAVHPNKAARMAARQGLKPHEARRPTRRYVDGVWYRRSGKDWVVDEN